MKIAFIGHGNVGGALANHMQRVGHDVTLAASDVQSESVRRLLVRNAALRVASPREAVGEAEADGGGASRGLSRKGDRS